MQTPDHKPAPAADNSRYWLYGGIALLVIAIVYTGVLILRARSSAADQSAAVDAAAANAPQVQFVPAEDVVGESVGPADAPVVVREFADYQCPACSAFEPTLEKMRKDYVDTGMVRFVFFDYPLDIHKNAMSASLTARCAGAQGHFWPMHDLLYARQQDWAELPDPLVKFQSYANELGLDSAALLGCIRAGSPREDVLRSQAYGDALGINATPSYGVNGAGRAGAMPYDDLKKLIDQQYALAKKPAASGTH
jgi:protein-disulfide isomerase